MFGLMMQNIRGEDAIPKGHCIPETILVPPPEPLSAVTTSDPPSLRYAPTLPTQEFDIAPLQRTDSNEAICDSNSQHSAESSLASSTESLLHAEAGFNGHVATGMAQHLDEHLSAWEEDQQRTSNIDYLTMIHGGKESWKLNDQVNAVLDGDWTSIFVLANEEDEPAHPVKSAPSVPDRHFLPSSKQKASSRATELSRAPRRVSSDVDGASNSLVKENTSASMTDAVQDKDGLGIEIASDDPGPKSSQKRAVLIGFFAQLLFIGILLTFLVLRTRHPSLFQF